MSRHGRHVKIVGKGDPARLGSVEAVRAMLASLVERVGMRALGEPHTYDVVLDLAKLGKEPFEDEGGVTGVVVLSTSHIAVHTWPARPFLVLDLFSCRDFSPNAVLTHLVEHLGLYAADLHDLSFALDYDSPRSGA
jgi:S-adenosylmethionine decarboxylase